MQVVPTVDAPAYLPKLFMWVGQRLNAVPFGPAEAAKAAHLYRTVARARGREIDLVIAASALVRGAQLWTLNPADFDDIPDLRLVNQAF